MTEPNVFQPPKPEHRLKIEAFNTRRWAVFAGVDLAIRMIKDSTDD